MVYASTVLVCIVSWYDAPYMENVRHPRPRGVSRDTRTYFSTCAAVPVIVQVKCTIEYLLIRYSTSIIRLHDLSDCYHAQQSAACGVRDEDGRIQCTPASTAAPGTIDC